VSSAASLAGLSKKKHPRNQPTNQPSNQPTIQPTNQPLTNYRPLPKIISRRHRPRRSASSKRSSRTRGRISWSACCAVARPARTSSARPRAASSAAGRRLPRCSPRATRPRCAPRCSRSACTTCGSRRCGE
jgi:hypothetical protein